MKRIKTSLRVPCVAATAFAAICFTPLAPGSLPSQLEAYYSFDLQNGDDTSGNGLNATLFGDVGFEPGLIGHALAPNGNNEHYAARTVSDPTLNFGNGDFTLQAWVYYNSTSGEQILLEKFIGATGPGWTFTKLSNNRFAFAHDVGAVPVVQSTVQAISLNTWHHLLIRRTSGTYELFFNNGLIATAYSTAGSSSTAPLLIGRRNAADGRNFSLNGRIDEVAIWSRSLANEEIETLYNGGQGLAIPVIVLQRPDIGADGKAVLRWNSAAGRVYSLHYSDDLQSGFLIRQSDIPATPPLNMFEDDVSGRSRRFWRVEEVR